MTMTRRQRLDAMAVTLEVWQGQIAGLQAKAMTAGVERQPELRRQIGMLRQRRVAYKALVAATAGASAAVYRDLLSGADLLAEQFRRLQVETEGHFFD